MWEKIKNILAVIGAVITIAFCTFVLVFLRRRDSDRHGSGGIDGTDSAVEDGITDSEERADRIESGISRAEDGITRCEEHLQRAEEILRNAITRSRKKEPDIQTGSGCNVNN